jgi:putative colanic acid biosynthesis acetyltransferase WcaF
VKDAATKPARPRCQIVTEDYQDLSKFRVPTGFLLWQLTQATLFAMSPQPLYGWRRMLLRLFGASIGDRVLVRPTARITFPWKIDIGECSWIGDHAELYSLDRITIGRHTVVSQRSYLCTASHDEKDIAFSYKTGAIELQDQVWIASDVFIAPGVTIGRGTVVGARSTVFRSIPPDVVAYGAPAEVRRARRLGSKAATKRATPRTA